jgi:uncharacterized protein involved in outer membrane biogenesis
LIAIGVLVAVLFLDSLVKKGVETAGPMLTKSEVRVDGVSISPLAGQARISGLRVGNPEGFKAASAIEVRKVEVALQLRSLLSDVVDIDHVRVEAPEITFEGGLGGNNLSRLLANVKAAAPAGGETNQAGSGAATEGKRFRVNEISLTGGKVNLSIAPLGGKGTTLPLPEIKLANVGTDGAGISSGELTKRILDAVLTEVLKTAGSSIGTLSDTAKQATKQAQETVKGVTDQAGKAAKGISDLFKKK